MLVNEPDLANRGAGASVPPPSAAASCGMCRASPWRATAGILCLMALVFLAALLAPVDYSTSDAQGTLLTSQALVQTGTLRLDRYIERTYVPARKAMGEASGKYRLIRGHCYYSYPVGGAVVGAPFVWLANLLGEDMVHADADTRLQNVLSAVLVALAAFLAFNLSRCWAGDWVSLWLAAVFVAGSPLTSTMGTALWSSGPASIFMLLALVRIARHIRMGESLKPWWLGILLACAFLCRPTAAALIAAVLASILVRRWRDAVTVLGALVIALVPFVVVSSREFGLILPEYYLPLRRLPQPTLVLVAIAAAAAVLLVGCRLARGAAWIPPQVARWVPHGVRRLAVFALGLGVVLVMGRAALSLLPRPLILAMSAAKWSLLSPSRGLLVFCPYLTLAGIVLVVRYRTVRRDPLFWLGLGWLALHLATVARPSRWHGGHCYGPRMFAEAMPAVMILVLIAWEHLRGMRPLPRRLACAGLITTAALGVFMHTYQGLFNTWTVRWNASPNIDLYERDLVRWRYAQFLAGPALVERRQVDHGTAGLPLFLVNMEVSAVDTTAAFFYGWALEAPETDSPYRRSIGAKSAIWIKPGLEIDDYSVITLRLLTAADSRKRVYIRVNGAEAPLLRIAWREPAWATVEFPRGLLMPNTPNEISFEVFPTDSPGSNLLSGIKLWRLRLGGLRG